MTQPFSPLKQRHSILPEVVREHFSDVAAFSYVLLEQRGHQVCFTGSLLESEKWGGRFISLKYALLLVCKSLDFLSILNLFILNFISLCVLPVFVLVIVVILRPGAFCFFCVLFLQISSRDRFCCTDLALHIYNKPIKFFFLTLSYVVGSCA